MSSFSGPAGQQMPGKILGLLHTRLVLDFFPYSDPDDCDICGKCRLLDVISRQKISFLTTCETEKTVRMPGFL